MGKEKFSWESGYFASLMVQEFALWEDRDEDFSITPQFEVIDTLFTLYNEAEEAGLLNTKEYNPENAWDIGYDVFFAECIKGRFDPNKPNYGIDITKWKHYKKTSKQMLLDLDKDELIGVMYHALDLMEQYNGRSKQYCIMRALGYEQTDDGKFVKIN